MNKRRISRILLCCVLILCLSPVVYAAEPVYIVPRGAYETVSLDYAYIFSVPVESMSFFEAFSAGLSCFAVVDGTVYPVHFRESLGNAVYIGNGRFFGNDYPDTGESFCCLFEMTDDGLITASVLTSFSDGSVDFAFYYQVETPADDGSLLTDFSSITVAIIDQIGDIAGTIVSQPFLLLTVGFLFFGGCIGIFGRVSDGR